MLDLVFAIDGSNKVDESSFSEMKNLIKASLNSYKISSSKTHVGIVTFGGETNNVNIGLTEGTERDIVERAVGSAKLVGGLRLINGVLRFVNTEMFTSKGGDRNKAQNVIVLLTSGETAATGKDDLSKASELLKSQGTEIIVVGVKKNVDVGELKAIASRPNNVIVVKQAEKLPTAFGDLESAVGKVSGTFSSIILLY